LKKKNNFIDKLEEITKEESTACFISYNVDFKFWHFDNEVQTVYVREHRDSPNSVEFYMLEVLQERIQKINPRYKVGILYEGK
jgi:hypothetical protein